MTRIDSVYTTSGQKEGILLQKHPKRNREVHCRTLSSITDRGRCNSRDKFGRFEWWVQNGGCVFLFSLGQTHDASMTQLEEGMCVILGNEN